MFFSDTPPVGISSICGSGALSDLMYVAPPTAFAGNTFTASAPAVHAVSTSVGVSAPGKIGTSSTRHVSIVGTSSAGLTMKRAPASTHARAVSESITVPAPISAASPIRCESVLMICTAFGTVIVISRTLMPPSRIASTAANASSADVARMTGTIPTSRMRSTTDTRRSAFHHPLYLGERRHARVAGRRHRQRAVRGAAFDGPLRAAIREEAVDQARCERIAAADPVHDLEIDTRRRFVERAVVPRDRAPVVARRRPRDTQRCRDHLQHWICRAYAADHLLERLDGQRGVMLVDAFDIESQRDAEVFLVAEEDIDERDELAIHRPRFLGAADALPERRTKVEVIREDLSVLARGFHRFAGDVRRCLRQRREDAPGVEPTDASGEETIPIDVACRQLRDRRVSAIGTTDRAAHAEAALREIETVARAPADAVIGDPALQHQIFDESSNGIVEERGDDGGAHAEAAPQAARDVVLAAAFPCLKGARRGDASVAGIEAQHHFAEGDEVVAGGSGVEDLHLRDASNPDP